jgi:hypothetical protein
MRVPSLKFFVPILLLGLLLGASSTACADTIVVTSITLSNFQFTPASGTATFTPTAASSRARPLNSLGESQDITSNTFPVAQSTASVTFANANATGNATNGTATAITSVSVGNCTCNAAAFAQATFTGTLVITGGQGPVDVLFSFVPAAMGQATTDQFGVFAEASATYLVLLNGVAIFSQDELLNGVNGPNQTAGFALIPHEMSHSFTLQFGAVNTIEVRVNSNSIGANSVPEPATIVLLISGLGVMSGLLKKRRTGP